MDAPDFPALLAVFLTSHLPRTRGCSANTIGSYRDAFVLFLRFTQAAHATSPEAVTFADLSAQRVEEFTVWLHDERGCGPTSANQRLAAIKSFLRFAQARAPELITQVRPVLAITGTKTPQPQINYLTVDAVKLLLDQANTARDLRDLALLACLYDTAARVQEIADLNHADLHPDKPVTITVTGKGRKVRTIPLTTQAAAIVVKHAKQPTPARPCDPLFRNRRGQRLTRAGIAAILDSHAKAARAVSPKDVPEHVTPHMLRHYVNGWVMWPARVIPLAGMARMPIPST